MRRKQKIFAGAVFVLTAMFSVCSCRLDDVSDASSAFESGTSDSETESVASSGEIKESEDETEESKESQGEEGTTEGEADGVNPADYDFSKEEIFGCNYSMNRPNSYGAPFFYSIFNLKGELLVDSDKGGSEKYSIWTDAVNGEVHYYSRDDAEIVGNEENSYDRYETTTCFFNSDGEALYSTKGYCCQVFDHYAIINGMTEAGEAADSQIEYMVVDLLTEEVKYSSNSVIMVYDKKLYLSNSDSTQVEIYNPATFELEKVIPNVLISNTIQEADYIRITDGSDNMGIMNKNGDIIVSPRQGAYYISFLPSKGYCALLYSDYTEIYSLLGMDELVLTTPSARCVDYNGTAALCVFSGEEINAGIINADGTVTALPYEYADALPAYDSNQDLKVIVANSTIFDENGEYIGMRQVLLDENYQEKAVFPEEYMGLFAIGNSNILLLGSYTAALYDKEGRCVMDDVMVKYDQEPGEWTPLCYLYLNNSDGTRNIYNADGELIGENLPEGELSQSGDFYLGRKGFSYGLMDFQGNMIYSFSAFSNMGE